MATPKGLRYRLARLAGVRSTTVVAGFHYRDYRFLCASTAINNFGMFMEQVLLGWLVLELTDSPFLVGAASAARLAPFFFAGIPAGVLADRIDRRLILQSVSIALVVFPLLIALLVLTGRVQVWHLLVLAFVMGTLRPFYLTAQTSYVYDVVGPARAMSSLALISVSQRAGGVAGSLLAGILVGLVGTGNTYLVMAASSVAAAAPLFLLREPGQAAPLLREPLLNNLRNYVQSVRGNRTLLTLMGTTAAAETLGFSHQAVFPVLARDVLKVGPEGLGLMMAFRSGGGIVGMALLAAIGDFPKKGALLLATLGMFGVGQVLLGVSPNLALALLSIALVNAMAFALDVLHQTLMQLHVPNEQRGRAMGSLAVAYGVGPLGHLEVGGVAGILGAPLALAINGAALVAIGALLGLSSSRIRRL